MYTYIICIYEKRKINPCFLNSFLFQVWVSYEADYVRAMHLKACLPQRHLSLPPALLRLLCMTMPNCLLFKLYTMLILQISMSMWAKRLKILLDSRINTLLFWRSSYHPWKQGEGKKKSYHLLKCLLGSVQCMNQIQQRERALWICHQSGKSETEQKLKMSSCCKKWRILSCLKL